MTPDQIQLLLSPAAYSHPVENIQIIETHISWIILTGSFAYKIKKPVDLGFLDFTDLKKRKHFCEEELRLNQRTASDIYVAVLPIVLNGQQPMIVVCEKESSLKGSTIDTAIDYAVQMHQFCLKITSWSRQTGQSWPQRWQIFMLVRRFLQRVNMVNPLWLKQR